MTTNTIPTAPRAMIQQDGIDLAALPLDQGLRSATRSMYPKIALLEALAGWKDGYTRRGHSSDSICEARRDFLDSFAYLCDIEKGGPTVTAAALQRLPLSNILWLAANKGIRRDVKIYAERMLQLLQVVNPGNQVEVQDDVLRLAVQTCHSRIKYYKGVMQPYARNCRMKLRQEKGNGMGIVRSFPALILPLIISVNILRSKLKKLSEPSLATTLVGLVDFCYAMRGTEVEEIRARSKVVDDDFRKLAHYIGRLGATRSSANTVVRAVMKVPDLRNISGIRTVEAPESRDMTIDPEYMSPYEIVRAICIDSASQNPLQIQSALRAIVDIDSPTNGIGGARAHLESRRIITTRVHAELQLADSFSRSKHMKFVDDDKYIGCSKPACYFCYNWLSNHKHQYIPPSAHNKIIPGCRGPDNDINDAGAVVLKEMYAKICANLDQHILNFLLNFANHDADLRHQYMSTEGSSRAPSRISTVPLHFNTP